MAVAVGAVCGVVNGLQNRRPDDRGFTSSVSSSLPASASSASRNTDTPAIYSASVCMNSERTSTMGEMNSAWPWTKQKVLLREVGS